MSFGVYLFLFLLSSMAVKQIATIAMYGSVFEWLRRRIQVGALEGKRGYGKWMELFTCQLCMCTQVSIWFIALPTMIVVQNVVRPFSALIVNISWPLEAFLFTLSWFLLSMAVGAVAIAIHELFSYIPRRTEAENELRRQQIRLQRQVAAQRQTVAAE